MSIRFFSFAGAEDTLLGYLGCGGEGGFASALVLDLEQAGYLTRTRVGRRNRYQINGNRKIGTPRRPSITVAQLLGLLLQTVDQQPFT